MPNGGTPWGMPHFMPNPNHHPITKMGLGEGVGRGRPQKNGKREACLLLATTRWVER